MTPELVTTLCKHAAESYRILRTTANELLDAAVREELKQIDEKLYLELFATPGAERGRATSPVTR